MTEAERLFSLISDKMIQSERAYMLTHTNFLSLAERSAAISFCKANGAKFHFYGGYPEAERALLFFLPDYMEADEAFSSEADEVICLLKCRTAKSAKTLSHRDYLGALLSLGLEREVVGDILVRENGADIMILKTISDYLLVNFTKAGNVSLQCEIQPISELVLPEVKTQMIRESVASVRLDNIVSAVFGFSRSEAVLQIQKGMVFINDAETLKVDARLNIGDKIVVRGKGKAYFKEIGGTTRKGRLSVIFEKFI